MNLSLNAGNNSGLPIAAGTPNYSSLLNPFFVKDLVTRYYPRTLGGRICAQDIVPTDIRGMGDKVVYRRTPISQVHEYTKGQILDRDGLNTTTIEMLVNRGLYFNLDLNDVDHFQIADVNAWIDGYKYDAVERIAMRVDRELLDTIQIQAHPFNRGLCAGASSRSYNMGAMGKPLMLGRGDNAILDSITEAGAVLSEANVDFADRYIVLPIQAQPVLAATTTLANALNSGLPRSMQLVGMDGFNSPIGGFSMVYFSNLIPRIWDADAGKWCYPCIFGRKDATGFITQISKNEYVPLLADRFGSSWRALFVYGMKVLRPEAVGVMYANFDRKAA